MWMKRIAVLAVSFALVAILFSQEKASTRTSPPPTGYQLVAAPITVSSSGKTWEEHRVFLVDSSTGNVWEYLTERVDNEHVFHPASFQPVPIKK
jgi:hypothetical protein